MPTINIPGLDDNNSFKEINNTIPAPSEDTNINENDSNANNFDITNNIDSDSITIEESDTPGISYDGYNDITVNVKDKKTPIVILFGPKSCGKTMTLVRLSRYLKENGYQVVPEKTFRDSRDKDYQRMCVEFPQMVNSDDAAASTSLISFMLTKVIKDSNLKCQILEAPGELYFDEDQPEREFPTYLNYITTCPNRKIWVFMLEPNWKNEEDRLNYVNRITQFTKEIKPQDKVILLMNKIDKADGLVVRTGVVKPQALLKEVKDSYPSILKPFVNNIPILSFFEKYRCTILPFQTGKYSKTTSGKLKYTKSDDSYPKMLWNSIKQAIKG